MKVKVEFNVLDPFEIPNIKKKLKSSIYYILSKFKTEKVRIQIT